MVTGASFERLWFWAFWLFINTWHVSKVHSQEENLYGSGKTEQGDKQPTRDTKRFFKTFVPPVEEASTVSAQVDFQLIQRRLLMRTSIIFLTKHQHAHDHRLLAQETVTRFLDCLQGS